MLSVISNTILNQNFPIYFLLFFLGASFASFLGVLVERGFKGAVLGGTQNRSKCEHCEKTLGIFELIPVFSYIFLLGRCKSCKKNIGIQALFSELFLGIWFVASFIYSFQGSQTFALFLIFKFIYTIFLGLLLTVMSLEDIKSKEVTSLYIFALLFISILKGLIFIDIKYFIISVLIASPFWIIYFFSKGKYIGLTDPYLFTSLNIFFGPQFALSLFLYSIWFGTFFAILYLIFIVKSYKRQIPIPFVPIISFSTLFILIFNFHIIKISDILLINEFIFKGFF